MSVRKALDRGAGGQSIVLEKNSNAARYDIYIFCKILFFQLSKNWGHVWQNHENQYKRKNIYKYFYDKIQTCNYFGVFIYLLVKILISDINITLHDANSNALEGGGGVSSKCQNGVRQGGGVSGPPKKCYILFEHSLSNIFIFHLFYTFFSVENTLFSISDHIFLILVSIITQKIIFFIFYLFFILKIA